RGMEPAKGGQDLAADQAPQRVVVRGVEAEVETHRAAVRLGLVAPDSQERPDDAVVALRADAGGPPARGQPGARGLDLVGCGVPGRPQAILGEGVAKLTKLVLGAAVRRRRFDDLGAEALPAEARVVLGLGAPELMVDVERADAVAEGPKRMPEACRVGATGDQADNVPARRNEIVPADVLFDPRPKRSGVHEPILRRGRLAQSRGPTSQPRL